MQDDDLARRVVELETRLAFQEQALVELSDALAEARLEGARQSGLLRQALQDLKLARGDGFAGFDGNDPASEPPPPHY